MYLKALYMLHFKGTSQIKLHNSKTKYLNLAIFNTLFAYQRIRFVHHVTLLLTEVIPLQCTLFWRAQLKTTSTAAFLMMVTNINSWPSRWGHSHALRTGLWQDMCVFTYILFPWWGLRVSSQLAVSFKSTKALLLQPAGPSLQVCVSVLRAHRHLAGLTLTAACVWTC